MKECKECGWEVQAGFEICDICRFAGNALRNQERGAEKERAKLRASLEKVRDELRRFQKYEDGDDFGNPSRTVDKALRMLEEILEGK